MFVHEFEYSVLKRREWEARAGRIPNSEHWRCAKFDFDIFSGDCDADDVMWIGRIGFRGSDERENAAGWMFIGIFFVNWAVGVGSDSEYKECD